VQFDTCKHVFICRVRRDCFHFPCYCFQFLSGSRLLYWQWYGRILPPQAYTIHSVFSASVAKQRREKYVPWSASFDYINREPSARTVLNLDCSVLSYYLDKDYIKPFQQWGEQVYPDASTPAQFLAPAE
jgi:hypothetical protein